MKICKPAIFCLGLLLATMLGHGGLAAQTVASPHRAGAFLISPAPGWAVAPESGRNGDPLAFVYQPSPKSPQAKQAMVAFTTKGQAFSGPEQRDMMAMRYIAEVKKEPHESFKIGKLGWLKKKFLYVRTMQGGDSHFRIFPYNDREIYMVMVIVSGRAKRLPAHVKALLGRVRLLDRQPAPQSQPGPAGNTGN